MKISAQTAFGFAVLVGLFLSSACSVVKPKYTVYYKKEFTWSEAQTALANRRIYSSVKSAGSPLALGMLMTITDSDVTPGMYKLGMCTAFMFDETTLLTNAHCVAKKVRTGVVPCSERIYFAYGGKGVNYGCDSVLFAHPAYTDEDHTEKVNPMAVAPDVVVLKMRPIAGLTYFIKSNEAIKADELLKIHSMDPDDRSSSIVFEGSYSLSKSFKITDHATEGYPVREADAQTPTLFISGNSGSPVVDDTGKVKGIGFANRGTHATMMDLSCLVQDAAGAWGWKSTCNAVNAILR